MICQNTKSILWSAEKKVVFGDKNSNMCCDDKNKNKNKNKNLMTEKTDLFLLLQKRMKKIFLRKEFHSQYEFMQS